MKCITRFFIAAALAVTLAACANSEEKAADVDFQETEFDFGVLQQSGGLVSHDFVFTYQGDTPITVTGTPSSCTCTTGKISKTTFQNGDRGVLTVTFDPNLHEEPKGRFFKTISMFTDPPLQPEPEVKIWAEIDLDLGPEAYKLQIHDDEEERKEEEGREDGQAFFNLSPTELKAMLQNKDFFLLDVHIPEQEHIPGTDAFIDYQTIKENTDRLPQNKDDKIVVYCRSGSMSRAATADLIDLGYTNVYNLEGGINAFNAL